MLAAALGFRVFLFQVPYVCFFVIIAGFVADMTGRSIESMFRGSGIASLTAQSVQARPSRAVTGFVSSPTAVPESRSFVKVLNIVHTLVWDVPAPSCAANRASLAFIGFVTVTLALSYLVQALRARSGIGGLAALVLFMVVPFGVWWCVSWWLPHRDCPPIALAPGAALFAVGTELLHVATVVWFPHHLASKSDLYGTVGFSLVLLLWAYFVGRIITLAAVLNAALWARFGADSTHPVELRRPSWKVPLVDDKVGRLWTRVFAAPPAHTCPAPCHRLT